MNLARLNLSHCSHDFAVDVIANLRKIQLEDQDRSEVAIWIDVNGPKVRTGKLENGPVSLKKGDNFFFVNDLSVVGDNTKIATTYTKELVQIGDLMCVDDGAISFVVTERLENSIRTVVENDGVLAENKGINFPQHSIDDLPALSAKDKADVAFAVEQEVDYVSVSCLRDMDDIAELRMLLGNSSIKILAKIENKKGMDNFESILKMADGIIIDRGYLGAEVELELVVIAQKKMINMANHAGKPIFIANQILESMRTNYRPTRSEAADVCNAVMDGADGLVLSAETAVGQYVLESLSTIRKICYKAEQNTNYLEYQMKAMRNVTKPIHINESIASSAVLAARQVGASLIVIFTELGGTARLVAKYRPVIPVLAATTIKQTARQLEAAFGLVPSYHDNSGNVIKEALEYATQIGLCKSGEIAIVTSGQVIGFKEGTTTKMQVMTIP
ncbi:pyruvate kinase [Globomyces pollinis-pini]|nr:pyruvate kinase [Globomyces pollinis-pini]